ncbi:MAG: potassium transporter KtrB [Oscillospiraceae bacterium]|nr:potassium transporter KtrB [Oscillospiraceae bacterium]
MRLHRKAKKRNFITTYIIAGGFLSLIILGAVLLNLPIASANGVSVPFADSLFTATTAVCVTGLVTVPTFSAWSLFGQIVILILIQLGGLGVISFTILFLQILGKRIGLHEKQLIRDAYNLDTNKGMNILIKKIFKGTFIIEALGAVLYSFVFVPEFGILGIWKSIFNSVSAFCNAGMDILGPDSLIPYRSNIAVNLITMALIVLGGIGFPIWFLTVEKAKECICEKVNFRKAIKTLPIYAKTVLIVTAVLIFGGAVVILIMEFTNDRTLGNLPFGEKLLTALFQSVTTRTAGFCTIPQEGLRRCTVIVCCILMFIGGSPSGTAGGIKTTTITVLIMSLISALSERNNTEIFKRTVNAETVRKATSVFSLSFSVMVLALTAFCAVQPGAFEDCLYEVVSAIGTVGLTRDLTSSLTLSAKMIIIVTMYLGRIGPISLALFFNTKKNTNLIKYPEGKMPVG